MNLSIIIVSWNVADLLKKCLVSIYQYTQGISFEIFVIDNDSQDETGKPGFFETWFDKKNFHIILNQKNLGFAAANNQGIKQSQGDFILLLNPDTELKKDSLFKMVEFMKKTTPLFSPPYQRGVRVGIGIAGCHLENPDASHQDSVRRFPGFWDQVLILLKVHHIFPRLSIFRCYLCTDFDYIRAQEVDQVMGAFFMIRREVIEQIGLLDEKFYIWFEEVDFCLRARQAGWLTVYTPITSVIHHFGQSFKQRRILEKQKIWTASLAYYFKKHHSWLKYVILKMLCKILLKAQYFWFKFKI